MTIGECIREARKKKGLSQEELAHLIGYTSKTSIAKIESNQRPIPQAQLAKLAKVLDLDVDKIINWDAMTVTVDSKIFRTIKKIQELSPEDQEKVEKFIEKLLK